MSERRHHLEAAIQHLLNDDEDAATKEFQKIFFRSLGDVEVMATDYLIRVDENVFLGVSKEYRTLAVEKTVKRLTKAAEEWKKASNRAYSVNDHTPVEIQRQAMNRWLTAIETFYDLADSMQKFGMKV